MPDPFSSFHINVPATSPGTLGRGESVLREVGRNVERPFDAPSQPPSRPLHEPFQLNAPRAAPRAKARPPSGSDDTVDNTVDNALENTIDDNSDQTVRLPAAPASPTGPAPSSLPVPPQGRREAEGVSMAPEGPSTQRSFLAGSVLGVVATLVVALLLIGGVLMLRGGDDDSSDELRARQEELLADAKNSAEKSDHAWAVAKADEVLKLDRTTRAAAAALVLRGKARLALSDRDGVDDLREALRLLPVGDGLRWEAERALTGGGLDQ